MYVKYLLFFLFIFLILIISATLGAQNNQIVTFHYLISQRNYKLSTLLAVLFSIGFILGWIICGILYVRTRITLMRAKNKIKALKMQLEHSNKKII
ncbi:putative membrane protein [Serratia symbiotica str. 'Cinara cedri']|nr:putative membrane protein [Serratia symbiotica str. 'Cinara cedri']